MSPNKYNKLAGKHVLIIGATSGIGFAVAEASLSAGASITISSSSASRVESTVQKLSTDFPNSKTSGQACDLSKPSVEQEIEALFDKIGKVDHIVYTAADKLASMPVQEITRDKIIAAGQMRFIAPMLVAKVGSRYLSAGPEASIIMTTGSIWEHPIPDWTVVAAYGGGICSMARNLALDLKPIRVNAVSPGMVDTVLWDASMTQEQKEEMFKSQAAKHPTGRVAKAEEIAEAYVYLMKDCNITGRIVSTDSGALLV